MTRNEQERRTRIVVNRRLQGRRVASMAMLPAIAQAGIAMFTGIHHLVPTHRNHP